MKFNKAYDIINVTTNCWLQLFKVLQETRVCVWVCVLFILVLPKKFQKVFYPFGSRRSLSLWAASKGSFLHTQLLLLSLSLLPFPSRLGALVTVCAHVLLFWLVILWAWPRHCCRCCAPLDRCHAIEIVHPP